MMIYITALHHQVFLNQLKKNADNPLHHGKAGLLKGKHNWGSLYIYTSDDSEPNYWRVEPSFLVSELSQASAISKTSLIQALKIFQN